jgi:hypothetical protein
MSSLCVTEAWSFYCCSERVTGSIKLASMWRVTPLDVVTLKLKARQTELDDKQEVIALLQDRHAPGLPYS